MSPRDLRFAVGLPLALAMRKIFERREGEREGAGLAPPSQRTRVRGAPACLARVKPQAKKIQETYEN